MSLYPLQMNNNNENDNNSNNNNINLSMTMEGQLPTLNPARFNVLNVLKLQQFISLLNKKFGANDLL